jgi:hypothetical protein
MKKFKFLLLALFLLPVCASAQTTTAYGITFPNAHPRLFWTSARLTTAQAWVTSTNYAGVTAADSVPHLEASLFTCYVMSGMAGAAGTTAATACTNVLSWGTTQNFLTCSQSQACDNIRVYGYFEALILDWLAPGCRAASCLTSGQFSTLSSTWDTYLNNQNGFVWGNVGMPGSNYFAGMIRNENLKGIATYTEDTTASDALLADAANKTVSASTRWNDLQNYVTQSGTPGGAVDTTLATNGYALPQQEGSEYGRYWFNYEIYPLTSAALNGRDMWKETPAFESAVLSTIYMTTPGMTTNRSSYDFFQWSDSEDWVTNAAGPTDLYMCDAMSASAQEYSTISIGKLARSWLTLVGSANCDPSWLSVDPGGSSQALNTLPLDYFASGPGYLFARNTWTAASATSLMDQLQLECGNTTANCVGHAHYDAGTFQVWSKGAWVAKESTCYAETLAGYNDSGLVHCTDGLAHNVPVIGGMAEVNAGCTDGRGIIERLETQSGYSFAQTDLTKSYQNNVCDGGHPARENGDVVSVLRELYYFRGINTFVVFDRFQTGASSDSTTFTSHCEGTWTLSTPNATCVVSGEEAYYTALVPSAPSMVSVNEADNSATCQTGECQYRLESTNSNPGNTVSYALYTVQIGDSTGFSALTTSVVDSNSGNPSSGTFTATLDSNDSLVLNKGATSSGGTIVAAGASRSLTNSVEVMTVTDSGNIWAEQTNTIINGGTKFNTGTIIQ